MEKIKRLTLRLRDPSVIARVEKVLRVAKASGTSSNAAMTELLIAGLEKQQQLDRIEAKLDALAVTGIQVKQGELDAVETNIDKQIDQWT